MNKYNTVKKNTEFNEIINLNNSFKNELYVIYIRKNKLDNYRFGISVGKKIGNAVCRNKIKRQIRYIIDKNKKHYQNNMDYIIIIRKSCIISSIQIMENKFIELLKKI